MATLVLSTIGRAAGGPLGALAGTLAGSALDRATLARSGQRPAPADLAVQGANYGDPLPRLFGTIRASGQVIWSSGIALREGEGKTDGGRSYAASFAVALSARPIAGVGRIWADSRLIRDEAGHMAVPGVLRVHRGLPDQLPDPLIASSEGAGATPAYRGLAYAVFEELALADFGNRIPQLSFEVIADAAPPSVATIAGDLFSAAGAPAPEVSGLEATVRGFGVARASALGASLEQLGLCVPLEARPGTERVALRARSDAPVMSVGEAEMGAAIGGARGRTAAARAAGDAAPGTIALQYLDAGRDLQPGLQRATRRAAGATRTEAMPAVLSAVEAKAIAERLARDMQGLAETREMAVPMRFAQLEIGDVIAIAGDPRTWRARRATIAGALVELELEAVGPGSPGVAGSADPGRVDPNPLAAQGPTRALVMDLPALPWEAPGEPRLLVAAGAAGAFWRRADVQLSLDGGLSWRTAGTVTRRSVIGSADTVLAPGPADRWDHAGSVEVTLLNADDWLQPATPEAVLAGANLALLGSELLHFERAEPLGARRFRLHGLLRGRHGTEAAVTGHAEGEPFALLDPDALLSVPLPATLVGGAVRARLVGPLDDAGGVAPVAVTLRGQALLPYAPTGLVAGRGDAGAIVLAWTARGPARRSWPDGADAVPGTFQLTLTAGPVTQVLSVAGSGWSATAAEQIALFGAPLSAFTMRVAEAEPQVGLGAAAEAAIALDA